GKAKKPANRSTDRAALTRARALIAERPTMKPKTALRKAGVTSAKKIGQLSEVMSERRAAPLVSKDSANVRRDRKRASPSSISQRAEPAPEDGMDHDLSKQLEAALNRITSFSSPAETQPRPNAGGVNGSGRQTEVSSWSTMLRWSPYGLMLWQASAMADFFSRATKSSLTLYQNGDR
ncbi:MAG: hypothetical protein ACXW1O_08695, partial [Halobacteriota archaeon]